MKRLIAVSISALLLFSFYGCDDATGSDTISVSTESGTLDDNSGDNTLVTADNLDSALAAIFSSMTMEVRSKRDRGNDKKRETYTIDTTISIDTTMNGMTGYVSYTGSVYIKETETETDTSWIVDGLYRSSARATYYNYSVDNTVYLGGETYTTMSEVYNDVETDQEQSFSEEFSLSMNIAVKFNGKYTGTLVGTISASEKETSSGVDESSEKADLTLTSGSNTFKVDEDDLNSIFE